MKLHDEIQRPMLPFADCVLKASYIRLLNIVLGKGWEEICDSCISSMPWRMFNSEGQQNTGAKSRGKISRPKKSSPNEHTPHLMISVASSLKEAAEISHRLVVSTAPQQKNVYQSQIPALRTSMARRYLTWSLQLFQLNRYSPWDMIDQLSKGEDSVGS